MDNIKPKQISKNSFYSIIIIITLLLLSLPGCKTLDNYNSSMIDFADIIIEFNQEHSIKQGKESRLEYKITNISNALLVIGIGIEQYGSVHDQDGIE